MRSGKGKYLSKATGGVYEGEYQADLKVIKIFVISVVFLVVLSYKKWHNSIIEKGAMKTFIISYKSGR